MKPTQDTPLYESLSTEEITRIFAMYLGAPLLICYNIEGNPVIEPLTLEGIIDIDSDKENMRDLLILKPLSSITGEHILEALMLPPRLHKPKALELLRAKSEKGYAFAEYRYIDSIDELNNDDGYSYTGGSFSFSNMDWQQRDFLIRLGYAVPLFWSYGHPLNGKTLLELGLAVEATTNNQ